MNPPSFLSIIVRPVSAVCLLVGTLAVVPSPADGAVVVWNGLAGDGLFVTGGNWVGGNPPTNTDWQDTGRFNSTALPSTVTLGASRSINALDFQTTGWVLAGSSFSNLSVITSAGAGTNTVGNSISLFATATWTVATGNTLNFSSLTNGAFYLKDKILTLGGGGTLEIESQIGGFGSGVFGINIGAATLKVNDTAIFTGAISTGARISMTNAASVFTLQGTVANANARITAGRITDGTGLGLQVTDIGGGFSQISVVPEPATIGLTGLAGLALALAFRRRS